eukprot:CAMPEP_0113945054 /NCGR_PEP_ID=MMETSP1339-20121228/38458_1 /TAXON_ID=94617 /ORGANISM="Fibrocapsa japonica" /LENGTH=187 /DNA_ID=CAMNT_0000950451 /DNA_START=24 /DNA_END=587 /DNA_ORIENTATION=- /assembly_acc=CAM_ASM_000762
MTIGGETADTWTEQDDQAVRFVVAGTSDEVDDSQVQTSLMEQDLKRLEVGGGSVKLGIAVVDLNSEEEAGSVQGALESAMNDGSLLAGLQSSGVDAADMGLSDFDVVEDECPLNEAKTSPGMCGCEEDDADLNTNGIVDCMECYDDTDCPEGKYCHCDGSMKAKKRSLRRNLKFGHVNMCFCLSFGV